MGGGGSYKNTTKGTLVVMEMFCILVGAVDARTYKCDKEHTNVINYMELNTHTQVQVKLGKSE